jgi:hypothetical protein
VAKYVFDLPVQITVEAPDRAEPLPGVMGVDWTYQAGDLLHPFAEWLRKRFRQMSDDDTVEITEARLTANPRVVGVAWSGESVLYRVDDEGKWLPVLEVRPGTDDPG